MVHRDEWERMPTMVHSDAWERMPTMVHSDEWESLKPLESEWLWAKKYVNDKQLIISH